MTTTTVRHAYLYLLTYVSGLLFVPEIAARWAEPSSLSGYSVGGLAGHLVRGVRAVETALTTEPQKRDRLVSAAEYWTLALDPDDSGPLNTGLRERGELMGSQGHEAVTAELDRLLAMLSKRLPAERVDRLVSVLDGITMRLDDYLVTRIVELAVHADDLATSVGLEPTLPTAVLAVAIHSLVDVARLRHGDLAVLRALSRRERQTPEILRAF